MYTYTDVYVYETLDTVPDMAISSKEADYFATVKDLRHAVRCLQTLKARPDFLRQGEHGQLLERSLFESGMISFRRPFEDGTTFSGTGGRVRMFEKGELQDVLTVDQYSAWEEAFNLANGVVAHQSPTKDHLDLRTIGETVLPTGQRFQTYTYHAPMPEDLNDLLRVIERIYGIAYEKWSVLANENEGKPPGIPRHMMEIL